jgi:neutral amino acid transport system permease protein
MRHVRLLLVLLAAVLIGTTVGSTTVSAQEDEAPEEEAEGPEQGFAGTLTVDDQPVEGVLITVADEDGEVLEELVSDAEGGWVYETGPGSYEVTLDVETLPDEVELANPDRDTLTLTVRGGRLTQPVFILEGEGGGAAGGPTRFDEVVQKSVDGVKFGLIIAMTAIGLSLIFGTTGLVNFAHAEMVTFGAVVAWFLSMSGPEFHLVTAAFIAVALGALLGSVLERGLFRPLRARRTGQFQLLVITIGLGIILRQALLIWFGANPRAYGHFRIQQRLEFGPVAITPRDLGIILVSLVILVLVAALLQRTRVGKAMRAVSDNVDLAESSGIDVRRIILFVWALGGGLAALGGVLQATATSAQYLMGFQLLLLMFAGVILGGLGTAYGAMVGSLVVGLATEVSTVWFSPELKYVWALLVLILVLLFRPQGILGTAQRIG